MKYVVALCMFLACSSVRAVERDRFMGGAFLDTQFMFQNRVWNVDTQRKFTGGAGASGFFGYNLDESTAFMLAFGGSVSPFEVNGSDEYLMNTSFLGAVVQLRDDRWLIRVGPGFGGVHLESLEDSSPVKSKNKFAFGAMINPGYEIFQSDSNFVLEAGIKILPVWTVKGAVISSSFGIGMMWY